MKHARRLCIAVLGSIMALAVAGSAIGADLQVDPVRLEITAGRATTLLRIRNQAAEPITLRVYALDWAQRDGVDVLAPNQDLILSPAVVTIPGNGSQTVRIGFRRPPAGPRAARVIVEEAPIAHAGGIRMILRLDLPLFAGIRAGDMSALRWSVAPSAGGGWAVEAVNPTADFISVTPAAAAAALGLHQPPPIAFGTILPGSRRLWLLPPGPAPVLASAGAAGQGSHATLAGSQTPRP